MATMLITMGVVTLNGGWLAAHLPVLFTHRLQSMFLLAALLRGLPALAFLFAIKELSNKPPATAGGIFWELPMVRSTAGLLRYMAGAVKRA